MKDNFQNCFQKLLHHEGGYVDHPKDPGGATNMGITFNTLRAWRINKGGDPISKADVKNLTKEEASEIYKFNYWNKLGCDSLPRGLDYAVFDFGVNSGVSRALRYLSLTKGDPEERVEQLHDLRLNFLKNLKTWMVFGKGWLRRVREVRASALSMMENK